jgi:hypothetical protein
MKIRITGRRRLPKAALGMAGPPICPIGQMRDPNNEEECIDDPNYLGDYNHINALTPRWDESIDQSNAMGLGITPDEQQNQIAETNNYQPNGTPPSYFSTKLNKNITTEGILGPKFKEDDAWNQTNTTAANTAGNNATNYASFKPDFDLFKRLKYGSRDKAGNSIYNIYKDSFKDKYGKLGVKAVRHENVNNALNKTFFANEAIVNPLMNAAGLITSQIDQHRIGKQAESKRRMLDLNEYSLPARQTRMGNFTHVMDSGLFDPRNTGFKSEGMATNPFSAPIGMSMAGGGQYSDIMPHAQPIQMMSEMIPPAQFSAGAPPPTANPAASSAGSGHQFAPAGRKYNKSTIIDPNEITFINAPQMDVDRVLDVLAGNEKSSTGAQTQLTGPQGQRASAIGKWGITSGTRQGIYDKNFKDQMSHQDFENKYNTDPTFERAVARKLVEEMLPKYGSLIFGAWYYPEYADKYLKGDTKVLNMIPREDYGNAITWGGYLKKAQDNYFKTNNPAAASDFLPGATDFVKQFNFDITSTTGGQHNTNSKHYSGNAIDIRTRNKTNEEIAAFMQAAQQHGYKVLDERQRPAGQPVWGGPHLHLESQKFGGQNNNKTMKIRIVSGPNQKMAYGGQSAYALNLGHRDVYAPMNKNAYDKSAKTLGPVPREEANIEAEKGETVYGDINGDGQNEHMTIGGKRHTQGGTPLKVPEGSFIFSDTKKMKIKDEPTLKFFGLKPSKDGYTPAEIAKKYDINKFRAALENPNSDVIQKRTAEKMIENYENKLGYLALIQESKKGFPQGIPEIAEKVLETELGQQIAGEYLQQQEQMQQQQQGGQEQMPNPGGPEPNGAQEYPQGPPQQGPQEEQMEGPQGQNPQEEQMEQMPPMQRYGGGIGYYAEGGYIPEDLGMMAYGGYAPLEMYQTAGQVGPDLSIYNYYSKAVVVKQNGVTIIKYPDGLIHTIFPNGRMKVQSSNGTTKMTNADKDPIDITKEPDGTPFVKYAGGVSIGYYSNGRAQYIYADGTKTMGTVTDFRNVNWEDDQDQSAPTTTAPTNTQPTATNSQADPNDPYPFTPYAGDKYGKYARTGPRSNASTLTKQEWIDQLKAKGFTGPWTNKGIQEFLLTDPDSKDAIEKLHSDPSQGQGGYGMPNAGTEIDKILGVRWQAGLNAKKTPPPPPGTTPVVTITPPATGGPLFECNNGVVTQIDEANKVAGKTYYASDADAQAACKPDIPVTETKPNTFIPQDTNTPTGWSKQDVRNLGTANYNASLIKRFVEPRMNVNPEFNPFVAEDPRFKVATRQAQFNMMNNMMQQYGSPQAYMANSSLAAGRTGEGAAADIANTNEYNVAGYNQKAAQDATTANQFAMYNAQNALTSRQGDQSNESKYLRALGQGADRVTAALNQGDTNDAMMQGVNATSQYFNYRPWDQKLKFLPREARAAYFNNLKNPGSYNQTEQDRKIAKFQQLMADGSMSENAALYASGLRGTSGGTQTDTDYDQTPSKNKTVTKTPTKKYGGYIMNNPYLK